MNDDIYAVNPDGSRLRRLTSKRGPEFDPSWSPGGRRIAYRDSRRGINENDEIYVMNSDGSGLQRVTTAPGEDGWPAWSPDGRQIAFSSTRDDDCQSGDVGPWFEVYVTNTDGSGQRRVTERFGQFVTWSPDGRSILVSPGGYIVRPDGSGTTDLPASDEGGGLDFAEWLG